MLNVSVLLTLLLMAGAGFMLVVIDFHYSTFQSRSTSLDCCLSRSTVKVFTVCWVLIDCYRFCL